MPDIVNLHAAKTQLSRLVDRAHAGEEIILAKAGVPYARLVPLAAPVLRQLGFLTGHVNLGPDFERESMRPLTEDEQRAWE
jgi:prevent-host-death family protein